MLSRAQWFWGCDPNQISPQIVWAQKSNGISWISCIFLSNRDKMVSVLGIATDSLYFTPKVLHMRQKKTVWKCLSRLWLRARHRSWSDASLISSCCYVWLLRKISWCLGWFDIHCFYFICMWSWQEQIFSLHVKFYNGFLIILGIIQLSSVTKRSSMSYVDLHQTSSYNPHASTLLTDSFTPIYSVAYGVPLG